MHPYPCFRLASVSLLRRLLGLLVTILLPTFASAAEWYVATTGSDSNPGTREAPFATLMHAQSAAAAGDTIYVRGGTYNTFAITATDANYNYVHRFNKNGIHWSAYPGETPLFDFSSVPTNLRVCAFHVTGSDLVISGFHVTGVRDGTQRQSECFRIDGAAAYVDFYDCVAFNNAANGFYFTSGARGSCTRCDAYNNIGTNADSIGNTDGFGAHGNGVVFRYCRAWNNSDDGFDCISSAGVNVFDHCWSFNHRLGGNKAGFKIGGFGADPNTVPPSPLPTHIVTYCVSAFNGAQGFYANHHPGQAAFWTKNTAFNNSSGNFNMLERTADMAMDIPGVLEVLHYNIAFTGTAITQANLPPENVIDNSWTKPGVTVTAADFLSTDWMQLAAPRSAGNNMPFVTFMHLAPDSDLTGLGAFDPPPAAPTELTAAWISNGRVDLSWTASPGATTYYVKRAPAPDGPYITIAARLTETNYSDISATGATSYYYVVTAMDDFSYDESANSNEAAAIQGPVATITGITPDTGVSASDGITNATALVLNGHATDTTGATGAGSTITIIQAGMGVIGTTTANAGGNWSFDYTGTNLTEGAHVFSAIASNNGHVGIESAPFAVIIDTTPPTAPTIAAASGTPLVFVGTAEANSTVTLTRVGIGIVGTTIADVSEHWTFASDITLESGAASFTATATDTAGNTSAVSASLGIDTSITVPVITGITPDHGISSSDALTNSPMLTLNGTSDPGATVFVARADLGLIGSVVACGTGQWTFDYTDTVLADGSYIFRAAAHENGNFSPFSADFPVTIDTVAPEIVSINRFNPSFPTITGSITSVVYRVTLTKSVYGVSAGSFSLVTTGDAAGQVTGVSAPSGTIFDVTVGSLSGFGELGLQLDGSGVMDAAGNVVAGGFSGGEAYTRATVSLGSGIWTRPTTGGLWSDEANWQDLVIADGAANSANFNTLNITANNTVQLDSPRTLNSLSFGDTVTASAASWIIDDGGNIANTLTLAGVNPTITVNALGTNATTTINAPLSGSAGLTKEGAGVLALTKASPLTGGLNLRAGTVRLPAGGSLALNTNSTITGLGTLQVAGGNFSTSAPALLDGATISQSAGTIAFDGGLTATGNGNVFITLSGGTFTAQGINIQRSSDGSINYARGLVVTGGIATVGSLQLGSVNSNGLASVEGGTLNVLGSVTIGNQTTSGRGGAFRITSGIFTVGDTIDGLVLSKVNGSNANNVSQANFLGGTSTVGKITLGFDQNMTAGSGTVTINGANAAVYLGSGGIEKRGASGMTSTITFTAGTLGAAADWSTTHPIVFSGTGAKTVRTANAAGDPFDITLGGVLSSTGPLTKTGAGTLTLAGTNTRTGVTTINEGTLSIGSIANGGTASNLGAAAAAATNLVINGGTLRYTGPTASHNRLFTIGINGATIDASGTGPLTFNSTTTLTVSGTGNRTLTLTGTNTDDNTFVPPIPNPSSGTTSLAKTGSGTWVLAGAKAFTGGVTIDEGTLSVTGTLAAGGTVNINADGTLAGTGTVNKTMVLNDGGILSPAGSSTGTLTGASLIWHGGGIFAADLGDTADRLALSGALTRGSAGAYHFAFTPGPGLAAGNVYTLISLGATDFVASDFSFSGLPEGLTGVFSITADAVQFTVMGPPVITSAAGANGTYGTLFDYAITATNLPTSFNATNLPLGLDIDLQTGVISGTPLVTGSFQVELSATNGAGTGTATLALDIAKAPATVVLADLEHTYDGTPKSATATTTPADLAVHFTYDGASIPPTNAGSYAVIATIDDARYFGAASDTLVIKPAMATITLGDLEQTYDGTPKSVSVTTAPAGLSVLLTYDGASTPPTEAGSYSVEATIDDTNYVGAALETLVIEPATATITLADLVQKYDGLPKPVSVTTDPTDLTVIVTYDGQSEAPIFPGTYAVVATIEESNYTGSVSGTLEIGITALVRHGLMLSGDLDGSAQVLLAENTTLNSGAWVAGDLLVPGTPRLVSNNKATYVGVLDGPGAETPINHTVTLNGSSALRYVVRRIDPIAMPVIDAPPPPAGTRDVSINNASQSAGDWSTVRNLTLNSNAGTVAVPPGTYGTFMANGTSVLVLGVPGTTEPTFYNLQGLTLNSSARLQIVGPVILTVAGGVTLNGSMQADYDPAWLTLRLAAGGLTLNSSVRLHGAIIAPNGTVTLSGSSVLIGSVIADRLTINSSASLSEELP